jgi:NADH oxidase (H2O2-forming)
MRHHAFDKWLTEKRTVEYVLEHLKDSNFDPEFYTNYESLILNDFNLKNNTYVKPKSKSWKRILSFNS